MFSLKGHKDQNSQSHKKNEKKTLEKLIEAVENDNEQYVKDYFIDNNNPLPLVDDSSLLHLAAAFGSIKVATFLLTKINVSEKDKKQLTPLHHAAMCNKSAMIYLLVDKGAKIDERSQFAETPLHKAIECNATDAVKTCLALGANVNACTSTLLTPILLACRYSVSQELASALVDHPDIDLNVKGLSYKHKSFSIEEYALQFQRSHFVLEKVREKQRQLTLAPQETKIEGLTKELENLKLSQMKMETEIIQLKAKLAEQSQKKDVVERSAQTSPMMFRKN